MSHIVLIDARSDSVTVSWPAIAGATKYRLEYRTQDQDDFELLSDKLSQTQARKRNLKPSTAYIFRVSAAEPASSDTDHITHPNTFETLSAEQDQASMDAPKATHAGSNQALIVSWSKHDDAGTYDLEMRENKGGEAWMGIAASLSSTQVKKKNLTSSLGYQFRVRLSGDSNVPFSPPSEVSVARGLSAGIQRFFHSLNDGTILPSSSGQPLPLADALGGKEFILLYASAHWCPPCRKFTPMLANWYKSVRNQVEIIFLSCDHDANGFRSYFATHPWMAVDYDDDARENLLAAIRVQGIPRLVVLSGRTGKILEDNAVGKSLELNRWRALDK